MYLEVIAVVAYIVTIMMTPLMRVSQKLVFHQSKCISAIKRILPPCMHPRLLSCICVFLLTAMHV